MVSPEPERGVSDRAASVPTDLASAGEHAAEEVAQAAGSVESSLETRSTLTLPPLRRWGGGYLSLVFLAQFVISIATLAPSTYSLAIRVQQMVPSDKDAMLSVVLTMPLKSFWLFLGCFLVLFAASGVGNGATYRMIPTVFLATSGASAPDDPRAKDAQRRSAAALGLVSAIGAYGGFVIPQVLSASVAATGGYASAFLGFVAAYAVLLIVTLTVYARPRGRLAGHRI